MTTVTTPDGTTVTIQRSIDDGATWKDAHLPSPALAAFYEDGHGSGSKASPTITYPFGVMYRAVAPPEDVTIPVRYVAPLRNFAQDTLASTDAGDSHPDNVRYRYAAKVLLSLTGGNR